MGFSLENRLVIGIASSALFDLTKSDRVFRKKGVKAYRMFQEKRLDKPLRPGVAFPFIKRLLSLNDLARAGDPLVEVIVLSPNSPDTGLRVMRSIAHHCLPITRAIFTQGRSPHRFMGALNMSLFLSANPKDVRHAVDDGLPAGQVLKSAFVDDAVDTGNQLRIAFDFDGVLANDGSEQVMRREGLAKFHEHEVSNAATPISPGPLNDFLVNISRIQKIEATRKTADKDYKIRLRVSLVTARNAPSHERAVTSLKSWGADVSDAFLLGGVEKHLVLRILKPHIFFDDQMAHLQAAPVPSVHVPFGVANIR